MPNILAAAAGYGGYISPVKLIVLVVLFFGWMPLVNWVYRDTKAVKANTQSWTLIISSTGAAALLIWLLAPLFLIGLLIYIIAAGAAATAYVVHRNARVADFEKVLTSEPTATMCPCRGPRARKRSVFRRRAR